MACRYYQCVPSIAEIARYADVSRCAASQILNKSKGYERFSPTLRARIEDVASKLGWVRDSRGLALQQGKTGVLALALRWSERANGLQRALISAVEMAMSKRDLHLQIISSAADALQSIHSNRCDGVLINAWGFSEQDILKFQQVNHAVLCRVPSGMRGVEFDVGQGLIRAVTHLHSLGHRKILWLAADLNSDQNDRYEVIKHTAERFDIGCGKLIIPTKRISGEAEEIQEIQKGLADKVETLSHETAVICYNEMVAIALYAALAGKRRVPEELSVVSIDDIYAPICVPPLTSVAFNFDRLAEKAVEQLVSEKTKSTLIKDPTDLSIRASTARLQ